MDIKFTAALKWAKVAKDADVDDDGLADLLNGFNRLPKDADAARRIDALDEIKALSAKLAKDRTLSANKDAVKCLGEVTKETDRLRSSVDQRSKEDDDAAKKQAKAPAQGEETEEEAADLAASLARVKTGGGKVTLQCVVLKASPFCGVLVAKKVGTDDKKKLLESVGGKGTWLPPGTCGFEDGKITFTIPKAGKGFTKKVQDAVKHCTGKTAPPLRVRDPESGEVEDDGVSADASDASGKPATDAPAKGQGPLSLTGSVGDGGKNVPGDVRIVQEALNKRIQAGLSADGKCSPKTIEAIKDLQRRLGQFDPDGRIEPTRGTARALAASGPMPPAPEPPKVAEPPKLGKASLAGAPKVWDAAQEAVEANIAALRKAVLTHYGNESPDVVKTIEKSLSTLDGILDKFDDRLAGALAGAAAAKGAERAAAAKGAKAIVAEYRSYVNSEKTIAHADANPFGVRTQIAKILTDAFAHIETSLG